MTDYPECEKLAEIAPLSQQMGEFLDENRYTICFWDEIHSRYWPVNKSLQDILAEHFEIDMNKVEEERRAMLEKYKEEADRKVKIQRELEKDCKKALKEESNG